MSYYSPDPYHQPEAFGLTLLGSVDRYEPDYSFDIVAVWYHEDGRLFVGSDSGCSCPSPFEDSTSLADLTEVQGWGELQSRLQELAPGGSYGTSNRTYEVECGEIIAKVRDLL